MNADWRALGGRLALCLLVFSAAASAVAQTTGSLEGRVSDAAGNPIPGVTIRATSTSLQGSREAITDGDGSFRIPVVPPGEYALVASREGFRSVSKEALVRLDSTAHVAMMLEPALTDEVTISGTAPPIDFASTTTGTNYRSRVTARLPVDRNYADVVKANPGVTTDRGATEGRSLALSISGATSAENQWIIDGVNTTNVFKGVQGKSINNEFVEEVEVKTGGYQAEYGRALGGVVNVITKSGGNEFHGDAFVYFDSTGTAAEKVLEPGDSAITQMRVVEGERIDFGLDLGGYLIRDRLWFFAAYNRVELDSDVSREQASTHVSTDARFPLDAGTNLYSGKLTWKLGGATDVVATVFADPSTSSGAAGADPRQGLGATQVEPPVSLDPSTWYAERYQGGTDLAGRITHLFGSTAVATIQASYHEDENGLTPPPGIRYLDLTCSGGTPEDPCFFPFEPNSITGGYGLVVGITDHSVSRRRQYAGDLTLFAGDHDLKVGGDYQDGETIALDFLTGGQAVRIRNEYGQQYYTHRFYAAGPNDGTIQDGAASSASVLDFGVFVQDTWRAMPGLTVNAGLRWDGEEARNYAGNTVFRFDDVWQPRLGIVWDPWRDGATKIFASAGRFSYAMPTFAAAATFGNLTFMETYNFDPVSVHQDPGVVGHETRVVFFTGAFGIPVDPDVRGWRQDELTIGVERLVGQSLTVGLKATYRTLGNVIDDRCDLDYTSPETSFSSCGLMNPGSDGPIASGNIPTCNNLDDPYYECGIEPGPATPDVERTYRGIEVLARKTLADDLWLQASYLYSSLRGNYDGGVHQGALGSTWPGLSWDYDTPQYSHNSNGKLALDRPHRFRLDGYWVTPSRLAVGLQTFVESGAPLNRLGYLSEFAPPLIHLVPRGSEGRLPTYWYANLTLSYPFAVGPATVTLQGYLFNVFDQQIALTSDEVWSNQRPEGYPDSIFDPNQEQTNPEYGKITNRQAPRYFRAALKISF
jgi:hypothetical protein